MSGVRSRVETEDLLGGVPRNFLRPSLLLLIAEEPSHGYDLLERLRLLGHRQAEPGGLYRCLRAMEQEGLVDSRWEPSSSGPPRRTYRLTPEGTDWLHAWAGALRESHRVLGQFLDRYGTVAAAAAGRGRVSGSRAGG